MQRSNQNVNDFFEELAPTACIWVRDMTTELPNRIRKQAAAAYPFAIRNVGRKHYLWRISTISMAGGVAVIQSICPAKTGFFFSG